MPTQIFYGRMLLALAGGLFCAALSYFQWVQPLDRIVYDFYNETSFPANVDDIVIVAIDERSLLELGRWPWPRERHVELLRQLRAAETSAVAMDILFTEPTPEYPQVDNLLAQAIAAHGSVVLPVFISQINRDGLQEMRPIPAVADSAAALGHVHIEFDSDGVARRVFLKQGLGDAQWFHFAAALSQILGSTTDILPGLVNTRVLEDPDPSAIIRSHENLIPLMGPAGTVQQLSYVDVMRGNAPPESLREKIVFVGATAAGQADNISTSLGQMSGVEVNANIFHALRSGTLASGVSPAISAGIVFLFTGITIVLFTRMSPRKLLLSVLFSALALLLASYSILHFWRLWISPASIILTLLIVYPLWNWIRLDATLGFIRRQLEKLEEENTSPLTTSKRSDIERTAELLKSLGHVAWWEWGPNYPAQQFSKREREWQHRSGTSSRAFSLKEGCASFTLNWHTGHEPVAAQLHKLFAHESAHVSDSMPTPDLLNIRLNQLDSAYREAKQNRDLIRGTLEKLGAGVILADLSGDILLINQQAKDLLCLSDDDKALLTALAGVELPQNRTMTDLVDPLLIQSEAFSCEGRSRSQGRDLFFQGAVIGSDKTLMLFVLTDVTELKRSERSRTEALNFVSHDLRAPMTSVLALIEDTKNGPAHKINEGLLAQIEEYIRKNISYAENFLQLAKIEHGGPLRLIDFEASSLIENAVSQLFHTAQKAGITLKMTYPADDVWVRCDSAMIERALINLIDNALKHSTRGDSISITLRANEDYAVFEVSDQGDGVSAADMNRIFDTFEQGKEAKAGVGLGLQFVKAVAATHGGKVSVVNIAQAGACFSFEIDKLPDEPG